MSERLMEQEWTYILDSLYEVNVAKTVDKMSSIALETLFHLIPCRQVIFTPMRCDDRGNWLPVDAKVVGEPAKFMDQFLHKGYYFDEYFYLWSYFRTSKVFRDSDIMTNEQRVNTRLYKEIYKPQGLYWAARCRLVHEGKGLADFSLFRGPNDQDFSERDMYILKLLSKHFALALGKLMEVVDKPALQQGTGFAGTYGLTARESEIAHDLLEGMSDDDLASQLCIAPSTLKKHISNIYRKTGAKNRVQLINLLKN